MPLIRRPAQWARHSGRSRGILLGFICGLLCFLLGVSGQLRPLEGALLDWGFRLRGPRFVHPALAVVTIDDAMVARAEQRYGWGLPIRRSIYADLIERLSAAGARTIALDVIFSEPSPFPEDDERLAQATAKAGNVIHAGAFQVALDPRQELPVDLKGGSLPRRFALQPAGSQPRRVIWAAAPIPPLQEGAAGFGHINIFPEEGGRLRRVPHELFYRGQVFPSLALAAAAHYQGIPIRDIKTTRQGVTFGQRFYPLDAAGDSIINWVGGNNAFPTYSATQLLDNPSPELLAGLKGKLVLIGVTALGAFEHRSTPFSNVQPVVEVQANAMDGILSGRALRHVPLWLWLVTSLLLPVAASWITFRHAGSGVMLVVGLLGATVGGAVTLLAFDWYLPLAVPLIGSILAVAAAAAIGLRQEWEVNSRAEASVLALARGSTLMGATLTHTGRDIERLKAIVRATASESLGAREVYLILQPGLAHGEDDEGWAVSTPVHAVARHVMYVGRTLLWPLPHGNARPRGPSAKSRVFRYVGQTSPEAARQEFELFRTAEKWARGERGVPGESGTPREHWGHPTLLVAPLCRSVSLEEVSAEPAANAPRRGRACFGALVVAGRRDGQIFSPRDAALLDAVAEQAARAIENWEYASLLRGRVEMANRDLREAYGLLSEQSAKLFAAVDSIEAALVVTDREGKAAFVNPAGGRVLRGATPILGEPVAPALASGDMEELAVTVRSFLEQGAQAERLRVETTRGEDVLVAQLTPLVSDEGEHLGAMLVATDVTAQRELDRMKTDFVGFVAHELRNPLTTILGYASLMDQNAARLNPEQLREMTVVIARHCRRMNRLITDLLDISRLEAGHQLSLHVKTFDLVAVCRRMVDEICSQINPRPPLQVRAELPAEPVILQGDVDRLEQVLANLLSNAVKYSPDGGVITLTLSQTAGYAVLEVADTGMGMTEEQVGRLFARFYRAPDATARGIKGTGLGLNLVKQLVEAHGGEITVRSTPGQGSTFTVTLPT